jgi:aspartate/tyrosine/aromatic aminotransferase
MSLSSAMLASRETLTPHFDTGKPGRKVQRHAGCIKIVAKTRRYAYLHHCCHNPNDPDLITAKWDDVIKVIAERMLIPFLDVTYQSFGVVA